MSKVNSSLFARFTRSLLVEISVSAITVSQSHGFFRRTLSILHQQPLAVDDINNEETLAAQFSLALQAVQVQNLNISVTLADSLVRMWLVTPPKNAASLSDCQAAAMLRFQALFGVSMSDWEMVADWDALRPFLACAVPRSLLARLQAVCDGFRLTLQMMTPHFVMTWNRFRKELRPDAWMAILNNDILTIAAMDQGRLVAIRSTSAPYELYHRRAWLEQHVQREAMLLNLTAPTRLQIQGALPPQWQKNDGNALQCQSLGIAESMTAVTSDVAQGAGVNG
ncbi:hypothetical protein AAKU67_000510 [Oxalobacteraceae bacterium GrIS 2.11]